MTKLTKLSLFSGIGGNILASEFAGIQTICMCEKDRYCQEVLWRHWPNIPIFEDVKDVTIDSFREATGRDTVNIVDASLPCQPFSTAGKQKGKKDSRYLWVETRNVITDLKPCWVVVENVSGILSLAADDICKDLDNLGYEVGIFHYEAAAVGAPHRRARVFFLAHSNYGGHVHGQSKKLTTKRGAEALCESVSSCESMADSDSEWQLQSQGSERNSGEWISDTSEDVAHTNGSGCKEQLPTITFKGGQTGETLQPVKCSSSTLPNNDLRKVKRWNRLTAPSPTVGDGGNNHGGREAEHVAGKWRKTQQCMGGDVDGIPQKLAGLTFRWGNTWEGDTPRLIDKETDRVNKLKALGNAVVPAQIYVIYKAIAEVEAAI
ncbi:MAG: DNA cytosine methyltransferase [Dehalococcoidia bacterium]|nr:DNA cytosine methyltransferase [Dehalococcoidia bacterium]